VRGVFEILLSNEAVSEAIITQLFHKNVQGNALPHKNNRPFKVLQIDREARSEIVGHSKLQTELERRIINNMSIHATEARF